MLILAFLICKIHALLTFTNVDFFMGEWLSPELYLELVDENQDPVETEKNLLIEISPLSSFYVYPTTKFTSWIYLEFTCILDSDFYLKLTCEGCELYITGSAYNYWENDDFILTTPSTSIAKVNNEISISYEDTYGTPYIMVFLITQEDFYSYNSPDTSSSGTLYVSFYTGGEKVLMIYFDDNTWTDADGIVFQIEDDRKYYNVYFTADYPTTFFDPLEFKFLVYSDELFTILASISCDITVGLIPTASLSGITTQSMNEGFAEFTNLYISTIGTYSIDFTGSCIDYFEASDSFTITGVDSISLSANAVYITINQEMIVTVSIFDNLNNVFTHETFVTLTSSSIEMIGTTSQTTISGVAKFSLMFNSFGETSLSAFTDYDLDSVEKESLVISISETMCIEWDQELCISCIELANVVDGECVCNNFSVKVEVHCECIEEYVQSGNECILACNNIFTDSDITGYYNEDFMSISIKFSSSVVQSSELDCSQYVILPDYLDQIFVDCLWIDPTTMILAFGSLIYDEYIIGLDASLTPEQKKCNDPIESLTLTVPAVELPIPIIDLNGPESVNLCDDEIITIENSEDSSDYVYVWTADPSSSELDLFLSSITGYIIEIPASYVQEGNIQITCLATSSTFDTSSSQTLSIDITYSQYLTVEFDTEDNSLFSASETISIQGFIETSCLTDDVATYEWKYLSSLTLDFESILANSQDPSILEIPQYTLMAGKTYSFKLTITIESILVSGYNSINIKIDSNSLTVTLDKASGSIDKYQDLIVTASATDPDSPSSVITFNWECQEGNSQCFNSKGELLEFISNTAKLFVSKESLREGATYSFKIIANTSDKSDKKTVEFFVEIVDLILTLDKTTGTITNIQDLIVTAKAIDPVSTTSIIQFLWGCHEENELCKDSSGGILSFITTNATLTVLKDGLRVGAHYLFNVTAYTISKSISKTVEFYVAFPSELSIQYNEDKTSENILFNAVTSEMANLKFDWSINPEISRNIPMQYSFLSIPRKSLMPNIDYNISLTATFESGDQIAAFFIFIQSKTPTCSVPDVAFLQNKWLITEGLCSSENTNLVFEFGCLTQSNSELWFTAETYIASYYVLIPGTCQNVLVSICNDMACTTETNSIPEGNRMHVDIISEFHSDISANITIPNAVLYYSSMITTQDQWKAIFLEMDFFFKLQTPTKGVANTFISSLGSMMLQVSLISLESANLALSLIDNVVSTYSSALTQSQLLVISSWIGKLTKNLDIIDLSQALSNTLSLYFEAALPGSDPLIQDSEIILYAARVLADSLSGLNILVGDSNLKIPDTIVLEPNSVYDIEYIVYPPIQSDVIFEVSFFTSGTYIDQNLVLDTPKSTVLDSETIYTTVGGDFSSNKNYECAYLQADKTWVVSGCEITESKDGKAQMGLTHQSTFKVYEVSSSGSCEFGAGPIVTACAWTLITLFAAVAFHIIDKNQDDDIRRINKYSSYPLTSIFIRQPNSKRKSSVIYLFSIQIILMCLIGIFIQIFDVPLEKTDKKYGTFLSHNANPGALAWGVTQIIAFPAFYFAFNKFASAKRAIIIRYIIASLAFVCFIGITLMTAFYCKEFTFYWIINYFIFMLLQIFLEIIYAIVIWRIQKSRISTMPDKVFPEIEVLNNSKIGEGHQGFQKISIPNTPKEYEFGSDSIEVSHLG